MNGRERVLAVLNHNEPDRVPTFEWEVHLVEEMTKGGSYADFIEQYDHDAVVGKPDYILTPIDDETIIDEWGVTRVKTHAIDKHAPIKTMEDVQNFVPPDPWAPYRWQTLKDLTDRFKGERAIIANMRDVWSNPRDLLGYANLFMMTITETELIEALVEKCADHSIALAQHASELGAEIVMFNDDIADNRRTLISLDTWDALFMPHFKRLVDAVHDAGLYVWKHTDGNIMTILDRYVQAGIDGIDPVDPIAGMTLKMFKENWGDRLAIKGNMDQAYLLMEGSKEQVREAVKKCIRDAGAGGGYVCSSSNVIHEGVRPELYATMLEAIREYGRYPLDMDTLRVDPSVIVPDPANWIAAA